MGIDFFKVDFAYAGALAGRRHDQELTRVAAFGEWAAHIERYGGLLSSSDRLRELDEWAWLPPAGHSPRPGARLDLT